MQKNIFSIKGRMGRLEYFLYTFVIYIILMVVKYYMQNSYMLYNYDSKLVIFIILLVILLIFFTIFSIKRLHDMGYSGKLLLLAYVILLQVSIGDAARKNFAISSILEIVMWLILVFSRLKMKETSIIIKMQ